MAWHLCQKKNKAFARRILSKEEAEILKINSIRHDFNDEGIERYWLEDGSYVLENNLHIDPNITNQTHLEWYLNKNPSYGC
jgi:hypothetical protein